MTFHETRSAKEEGGIRTVDIVYTALAVALIAICSWINIPTAVPFTLQTFAVFAVLMMLGSNRGLSAVTIYVLMGAIGIPVFAGFSGGMGIILGSTGGYILGFLFIGLIYMLATKLFGTKPAVEVISLVIGLAVCYAFGTAWFMYVYIRNTGPVGIMTVLSWCVFPFIIPDIAKLALAFVISRRVRKVIN
ncbi:MAG: biotin transporter BioY [Lachnospiraceae bacterium]|nr:biotin transporter BioY [Lachnospiraceae bacterium]